MTDLEGGINKNKCVCQTENSWLFFLQSQQNFKQQFTNFNYNLVAKAMPKADDVCEKT